MGTINFDSEILVDDLNVAPEQPNEIPVFDSLGELPEENLSYTYTEEEDAEITLEEVFQIIIEAIRKNPYILDKIRREVSSITLKNIENFFRTKDIEIDLWSLYQEDQDFRDFIAFIVAGDLVSKDFPVQDKDTNTVKIYYVLPQDEDDINYRPNVLDKQLGIGVYKASPAITTFSKKVIDAIGKHYPKYASKGQSFYATRLKINAKKVKTASNKQFKAVDVDLSQADNMSIANMLLSGEVEPSQLATLSSARISKINTLVKILKDNQN